MKIFSAIIALVFLGISAIFANLFSIPYHNTSATRLDTLIVLGYPANPDGTPSPEERERVLEAVREYKLGVAPAIIITGGPAHNQFVEAHVMAALAIRQGVPASAIVEEDQAQNTIQNIFYSSQIMQAHRWHSAEVVSSAAHLRRAAMILQAVARSHPELAIEWRTHAAAWPYEYSSVHRAFLNSMEAARCLQIRIFGLPRSRFLP